MSIFTCPKCGFKDSPCWRSSKYHPFAIQTRIEELETWEPDLVKQLKDNPRLDLSPYHYRLTKTGRVYRIPLELKSMYYKGKYSEKYKRPPDPKQKKLV